MDIMQYAEVQWQDVIATTSKAAKVDLNRYIGYMWSEKIDGWHAIWDGKGRLYTKSGKRTFPAPKTFMSLLPQGVPLSGELVLRRQQATKVVDLLSSDEKVWEHARFYVFDTPTDFTSPFSIRTKRLKDIVSASCRANRKCALRYIEQHPMTDVKQFLKEFQDIVECKGKYEKVPCLGEGVVLTNPSSLYESGKVSVRTRFKLKRRQDAEGVVIGYVTGKSLKVKFGDVEFKLGLGLTHEQRKNLPKYFPMNSLVKFSFRSLGEHGTPKEARIIGQRHKEDMLHAFQNMKL